MNLVDQATQFSALKQEWYYKNIIEETTKHHPQAQLLPQFVQVVDKLFPKIEQ